MNRENSLNNFFQYEGDTFVANYYPKNTEDIIITFQSFDKNNNQKNKIGWGVKFLIDKNISIMAINPKVNNWYRGKDLQDFMESSFFMELLSKYQRHLFAGGSMGGFGALVFSSIVKNSEVLAFNPLSTLNKDVVTWRIRFKEALKQDWTGKFSDVNKYYLNKAFIIYDYFDESDRKHAARIVGDDIVHLHFNHVGHAVANHMKEVNVLKKVMTMFLNNNLSSNNFEVLKESRKGLKSYQIKKINYLIQNEYYDRAIALSDTFKTHYDLANIYRDNAINLEKKDIKIAFKLMKQAYKIRKGSFIKLKLDEYQHKLVEIIE